MREINTKHKYNFPFFKWKRMTFRCVINSHQFPSSSVFKRFHKQCNYLHILCGENQRKFFTEVGVSAIEPILPFIIIIITSNETLWVLDVFSVIVCSPLMLLKCYRKIKTSMMWPSQNFLLYIRNIIKIKVTEWINNLKKYVIPPPPLWGYIQHVQIITI